MSKEHGENPFEPVIFSPTSLSECFSMLYRKIDLKIFFDQRASVREPEDLYLWKVQVREAYCKYLKDAYYITAYERSQKALQFIRLNGMVNQCQ